MFCPKCGTQLNDNAAFCNVCGQNLQAAPKAKVPASANLLTGKKVSIKDFDFLYVVIAGIFAFFATVLMHSPVISTGSVSTYYNGAHVSAECTLLQAGYRTDPITNLPVEGSAVGQIILTIITFLAIAYMFLPYIKYVPLKQNVLNFAVPAFVLLVDLIFYIIALATNPMGDEFKKKCIEQLGYAAKNDLGLSMDGWLVYLCLFVSIGILAWLIVKNILASRKK